MRVRQGRDHGHRGLPHPPVLAARTNQRNGEYGGDRFANRTRLDVEIVRDTREACGPDYIIIFHLSLLDLVERGNAREEVCPREL